MKINLTEFFFLACGVNRTSAKSMKTRICKKLSIPIENDMIELEDLNKIKKSYEQGKSLYKDQIIEKINEINETPENKLSMSLIEGSNILLKYDPFDASFLLPKLLDFLREENNHEALAFFNREQFRLKNFIQDEE